MDDIRVALAVFDAALGQITSNLKTMERLILEARHAGCSLICFPEMSLTGYCSDERIRDFALLPTDGALTRLQSLADREDITILAGLAEKDAGGHIYAAQAVILPGRPLETYRKLHIAPPEQGIYTEGDTIPVFDIPGLRFGIQLCYDAHFPFLSTRMAEMGVDVIFIPHASPRGTSEEKFLSWMRHIPARAYDNGIYVLVCNQCGSTENTLDFPGLAFAVDPSGLVMTQDLSGREGLLTVDVTHKRLDYVRSHRMRYFLPNQRRDL